MSENTIISTHIELLGKPYQIRCQEHEISALNKAADYLNANIKNMPNAGKILAPDKLAVMAALNITSQLLELEQQMSQHIHFLNQRLGILQAKMEAALPSPPSLELELESFAQV